MRKDSMKKLLPPPILKLPEADVPLKGVKAYLSQSENHQIIFMQFSEDTEVGEHFHEAQWAVVLDGKIDLTIGGVKGTYTRGDQYFIPKGVKHSARIYAGYADATFFDQPDRYRVKAKER
jgi:quercetin dioxygenase-like cupin family protein